MGKKQKLYVSSKTLFKVSLKIYIYFEFKIQLGMKEFKTLSNEDTNCVSERHHRRFIKLLDI